MRFFGSFFRSNFFLCDSGGSKDEEVKTSTMFRQYYLQDVAALLILRLSTERVERLNTKDKLKIHSL